MTSKNPDAALSVQATYNLTVAANIDFAVKSNSALTGIKKVGGVPDLKNCFYYFIGNISNITQSENNFGNYEDIKKICQYLSNYPTYVIRFFGDDQVSTILTLFKKGNFSPLIKPS
jgi:hypothetical protein